MNMITKTYESNWQVHSDWARESAYNFLNSQSKDLYKKILAELVKTPNRFSKNSIDMSAAFAFYLLEGLASGLGTQSVSFVLVWSAA